MDFKYQLQQLLNDGTLEWRDHPYIFGIRAVCRAECDTLSQTEMDEELNRIMDTLRAPFTSEYWTAAPGLARESDTNEQCICTHVIKNQYYIKHRQTGTLLQLGSRCITKCDSDLGKDVQRMTCMICDEILLDRRKKYQRDGFCGEKCMKFFYFYECPECKERNVPSFDKESGSLCDDCEEKKRRRQSLIDKGYTGCVDCGELCAKGMARCLKCYKIYINNKHKEENYRKCIDCHKFNIHPSAPVYCKRCKYCYTRFKRYR